jgi:hypothetical protein
VEDRMRPARQYSSAGVPFYSNQLASARSQTQVSLTKSAARTGTFVATMNIHPLPEGSRKRMRSTGHAIDVR